MTPRPPDRLDRPVELRRRRRERARREGERSLAEDLALAGVIGWLIVGPALLGIFAGRWLDRRLGSGVFWSGALLALGLAVGCALAWRRMRP